VPERCRLCTMPRATSSARSAPPSVIRARAARGPNGLARGRRSAA
jgi:hypothetical protein